jgi:hypothetical protein
MDVDGDVINHVDFQDGDTRNGRRKQIETRNFRQDCRIFMINGILS